MWYSLITQSITHSLKGSGTKENNEWIPQFGSKWNFVFDHKLILDFATIYLSIQPWKSDYCFFFFELKDISFTEFCWFSSTNMNHHRPPLLEPPFHLPPHSTFSRLFQSPCLSSPESQSKFPLAIYLKIWTAQEFGGSHPFTGAKGHLPYTCAAEVSTMDVPLFIWKPGTLHSFI